MARSSARKTFSRIGFLTGLALLFSSVVSAQMPDTMTSTDRPREFENVGIDEKLGTTLDLNEKVRDESGSIVPLSTYFTGRKPVILSFVYYNCPGLCNFHLNGLTETLKDVDWSPGQKFEVVAFSFDPKETPDVAAAKKKNYMKLYGRPGTENGWHFVTADPETVARMTAAAGFKYRWDEEQKQWAHASAAILVTPDGKIARYLHGIMFDASTLKMALNEAGDGRVGGIVDKMIWYCFHYDPHQSKYTIYAARVMQLGGALIVLVLAALLLPTWMRSRRMRV